MCLRVPPSAYTPIPRRHFTLNSATVLLSPGHCQPHHWQAESAAHSATSSDSESDDERENHYERLSSSSGLPKGNKKDLWEIVHVRNGIHFGVVLRRQSHVEGELHHLVWGDPRLRYEVVLAWSGLSETKWKREVFGSFTGEWLSLIRFVVENTPLNKDNRCQIWVIDVFYRLSKISGITGVGEMWLMFW